MPSAGTAVSFVAHALPLSILLLLGHAATEPAGSAPGAPGVELAVAFGLPNAAPTEEPLPLEELQIPELMPLPQPAVEEAPPELPVVEEKPDRLREPDVALLEEEPPPPEPPRLHPEPPKPAPPAKPKLPKVVQRPAPKPVRQAAVSPTDPVAASLGAPEAAKGVESVAPPSPAPATGALTTGAASGLTAPAEGGPLVLLDPAYREPPMPPPYPPRAVLLGQQGQVIVRAAIDPKGTPEEVVVWTSSGFPLLDKAAVDAVRRWRFVPARRGGAAVAAWVQVPVNFKLR
jgi:protein TonB